MKNKDAVLIRVGADSGNLGQQSPILSDNRYEYIPVGSSNTGCYKYSEMIGMTGKPLMYYIKRKLNGPYAHYDPDFIHLTYGDAKNEDAKNAGPKLGAIKKLQEDDLLVFWAGFNPWDNGYNTQKNIAAIIGWLIIEYIFDWDNPSISDQQRAEEYQNWEVNAHYRQSNSPKELDGAEHIVVHARGGGQLEVPIIIGERIKNGKNFTLNQIGQSFFPNNRETIYYRSTPYHLDYNKIYNVLRKSPIWKPTFKLNCKRRNI